MSMATDRVLCVDPDKQDREKTIKKLTDELTDIDVEFETAGTLTEATETLTQNTAIVITERDLSDGTGLELIDAARSVAPDAGYILYTDTDPDTIDTTALQGTITEYVGKDSVFGVERLTQLLRTTLEERVQTSYPLPQNESERIAALQSYDLDSDSLRSSLDRITRLAADHFDVERASINIINEHSQDFLSCYGDTNQWESTEREDSICTFTILEDDNVMTVKDVSEDPRFESRSETLIEMGIQSYMGANLVTSVGLVIGPLCIYDDEPREFSTTEQAYLQDLAAIAIELIELHTMNATTTNGGRQ